MLARHKFTSEVILKVPSAAQERQRRPGLENRRRDRKTVAKSAAEANGAHHRLVSHREKDPTSAASG